MSILCLLLIGMLLGATIGILALYALFTWDILDHKTRNTWVTQVRLWFKKPTHMEQVVRWVTIVFLLAVASSTWRVDADSAWGQFRTEASSVAVAVIVLEELSRFRNRLEFKQSIIRQLASRSNNFALEAVDIARASGWHSDRTLVGVSLGSANLSRADLSHANLQNAKCWATVFCEARFWYTNLEGAYMRGCLLTNAQMQEVNLRRAELSNAGLYGAVLIDAKLQRTNLLGAKFRGEFPFEDADLTGAKLDLAVYDSETTWPENYDPEAAGAINRDRLTDERWQRLLETYSQQGIEWAISALRIQAFERTYAHRSSTRPP